MFLGNKNQERIRILSNIEELVGIWFSSFSIIAVTLYIAVNQPNGIASVGLYTNQPETNFNAIYIGIIASGSLSCLILFYQFLRGKLRKKQEPAPQPTTLDESLPQIEAVIRYKKFWERTAHLLVLIFEVVAEDLLSRGYLVLFMGTRTHSFIPWIIVSIAFSVVAHLYQGKNRKNILSQFLFAAFFIGITIATKNLLAAIAPHLLIDIAFTFNIWRRSDKLVTQKAPPTYIKSEKRFYSIFIPTNIIILLAFYYFILVNV